jgi:hypothetical protein
LTVDQAKSHRAAVLTTCVIGSEKQIELPEDLAEHGAVAIADAEVAVIGDARSELGR